MLTALTTWLYGEDPLDRIAFDKPLTALKEKTGVDIKRQQIDLQPIRTLGEHKAHIRLTMDLIPEIKIIVYREGEANPTEEAAAETANPAAKPVEEAPAPEAERSIPKPRCRIRGQLPARVGL